MYYNIKQEELSPDYLSDVENQKLATISPDVSNTAAANGGTKFGWIQGVLVSFFVNLAIWTEITI